MAPKEDPEIESGNHEDEEEIEDEGQEEEVEEDEEEDEEDEGRFPSARVYSINHFNASLIVSISW